MSRQVAPPWWHELPLIAIHLVVVAGFARVYEGGGWAGPLVAITLGAHGSAIAARRTHAHPTACVALATVGAALVVSWVLFGDTLRFGLPTGATVDAAVAALDEAQVAFPEVIAPTEVLLGFQLAAGLALWIAVWFADWTAYRLRATVEAVVPATSVFVFCAILGSGSYQVVSAAAFATAVLAFVAVQRVDAARRDHAWLPGHQVLARSLLRSAAAVATVAVIAGVVIAPSLPGVHDEPLVTWRGKKGEDAARVTVSPMVELKKRLVEQSSQQAFEVVSTRRSYWRLTSLDRFDGQIWSSSGEFRPAEDRLPSTGGALTGTEFEQTIRIDALAAIWVPSGFEAVSVEESDEPLRWDPDSSTLIVDASSETSDGLTYTVRSRAPELDPVVLGNADGEDPPEITERYGALPDGFPALASTLATTVTNAGDNRYEQARLLQDFFRTEFDYSLTSPAGHSDDALVDFLESRVGYCEQFAGAYAAMARSLGIPARVAVGFTPGIEDPDDPGRYQVLGQHAHAWPEVYFPGVGWVPFEPTPQRGIPGAESYTGVAEQQAPENPAEPATTTTTTTAPTTTEPGATTTRPETTDPARTRTVGGETPARQSDRGTSPWAVLAVVAVGGLLAGAGVLWFRRRAAAHRRAALSLADRAWSDVLDHLARKRQVVVDPAETHAELAARVGTDHPDLADALTDLAGLVAEARWSPSGLDPERVPALDALRDQLLQA